MAKILIADDSNTDRTYLSEILKSTGHELLLATNGEEAENIARTQGVDLIVLDVIMPGKNGFQVCRDLKKSDDLKSLPIILTTSKSGEGDKFWGKKQGADEYLVKPVDPQALLAAVAKYLG